MKKPTEEELRLLRKIPWTYLTLEQEEWLEENDPEWLKVRDYYDSVEYLDYSEDYAKDFRERYPKCPEFEVIEEPFDFVLDSKEKALQIVRGKLKAVVLPKNDETRELIENKEAMEFLRWAEEHKEENREAFNAFGNVYFAEKQFETIHIHDKENTWFIDAELACTNSITCVPEDVGSFSRRTHCHDLDGITRRLGRQGVDLNERPYYYYFEINDVDDIIDTNLK